MADRANDEEERASGRLRRRLRGFAVHLAVYFVVMAAIVPVNILLAPETPWFFLPIVGWAAPLAIHAAYAMGLFGRRRE